MFKASYVLFVANVIVIGCADLRIPKTGIFLFLTEEGQHCYTMLSLKAKTAFDAVRELKNSQMRAANFEAFDFHRNLYNSSPEAALCYLEMAHSIDEKIRRMDEEAQDFIQIVKVSYIDGPSSAYERLSRVQEVPHAIKGLSDTAKAQIYEAFPNFKLLSSADPRDQSARLMRQIYSNRG